MYSSSLILYMQKWMYGYTLWQNINETMLNGWKEMSVSWCQRLMMEC